MFTEEQALNILIGTDIIQQILVSGNYTYIGTAQRGSLVSEAKWKIKRVDTTGNIRWSDNAQIFNNATSITYA